MYMKKEVAEARHLIEKLDEEVMKSSSFREKGSRLLEEAHRALGRLEQVSPQPASVFMP